MTVLAVVAVNLSRLGIVMQVHVLLGWNGANGIAAVQMKLEEKQIVMVELGNESVSANGLRIYQVGVVDMLVVSR